MISNKTIDKLNGRVSVLILAGGSGNRFDSSLPKQYWKINGEELIIHTVSRFYDCDMVDDIIITADKNNLSFMRELVTTEKFPKVRYIVEGGENRNESAINALKYLHRETTRVLIHDAARPCVSDRIIREVVTALDTHDAVAVCTKCTDSIVKVNNNMTISEFVDRSSLYKEQTPQGFKTELIRRAYDIYLERGGVFTDDCGLIIQYKLGQVFVVNGEEANIKITYQEDIKIAEMLLINKSNSL